MIKLQSKLIESKHLACLRVRFRSFENCPSLVILQVNCLEFICKPTNKLVARLTLAVLDDPFDCVELGCARGEDSSLLVLNLASLTSHLILDHDGTAWFNVPLPDKKVADDHLWSSNDIRFFINWLRKEAIWEQVDASRVGINNADLSSVELDVGPYHLHDLPLVALTIDCTDRWVMADLFTKEPEIVRD